MRKDVTRTKAQRIVSEVLGAEYFCRKGTKTAPGARREISHKPSARIVGSGDTWLDAVIAAAARLKLPDVLKTAQDLKVAYVQADQIIPDAAVSSGGPGND